MKLLFLNLVFFSIIHFSSVKSCVFFFLIAFLSLFICFCLFLYSLFSLRALEEYIRESNKKKHDYDDDDKHPHILLSISQPLISTQGYTLNTYTRLFILFYYLLDLLKQQKKNPSSA